MEIEIKKIYRVTSTWNYDDKVVLVPVPNNIIKVVDIINNNIIFEYIDRMYNDYKFLLSSDKFISKLNPIMIKS